MANGRRREDRRSYDDAVRIGLLETDADAFERAMTMLREEWDREIEGIRGELKGMKTVLIGMLISISTAALLFAINIAVTTG